MGNNMFCFQCEQTAGCQGCTRNIGVCGKTAETANLQDQLTGALISLASAMQDHIPEPSTDKLMIEGLFMTLTNVNFDNVMIQELINKVQKEKRKYQYVEDYDVSNIWNAQEDIRSLKSLILFGIRGMAAYAFHAAMLGYQKESIQHFFYDALRMIRDGDRMDELLHVVMECGKVNLSCMELLDEANTKTFGNPIPANVSFKVEKGPFIVVSGHDLYDLKMLLEATKDRGVSIYTHGEMLPAHGYPELRKYPHLKGNYGTAWQNQQKEFADLPAPILFTTNCIMPVKESYRDRVFTTNVVGHPDMIHIDETKDYSLLIDKALELGGFHQDMMFHGINGGTSTTTGFGHESVLSYGEKIISAIQAKEIRHVFLVGGCDGAKTGRNYYTEFAKQTPSDTMILTLACGKYRFHDLTLGTINGLPRMLDLGQCNDAYSAIKIAVTLAKALRCEVNDLPLSMILSWYEQKAVCILLTLLYLGIQNIYLGPTLPAFLSPNIADYLIKTYHIKLIGDSKNDLNEILS